MEAEAGMGNGRYAPLRELLRTLGARGGMHFCVHDLSGILNAQALRPDDADRVHSTAFCTAAKSTPAGYRLCIRCKMRANRRAAEGKRPFHGYCPCGLYEAAWPVVIGGRTQCIVYAGGFTPDREKSAGLLRRACRITKAPEPALLRLLGRMPGGSPQGALRAAECVASYILLLCAQLPPPPAGRENGRHWAVEAAERSIRLYYDRPLSLGEVAGLNFVDAKYLGRLFRRQTGRTFHAALSRARLEKAAELLVRTDRKILDVALACGFGSASYFDRLFLRRYGEIPAQYRKSGRGAG